MYCLKGTLQSVRAVCLALRLLDLFLGKLTPHPKRAAIITRYVTCPLLGLADVGSYALLPWRTAWRNTEPWRLGDRVRQEAATLSGR